MKRSLYVLSGLLLILFISFLSSSYIVRGFNNTNDLVFSISELSEDECIEFIVNNGVDIPNEFVDSSNLGSFIKNIMLQLEYNPNTIFAFNSTNTLSFVNQIKEVVLKYYDDSGINVTQYNTLSTPYTLIDSIVYGDWDNSFYDYNCYGFAINKTNEIFNPGHLSGQFFNISLSIYEIALLVEDDLNLLGNDCVKITSLRPSSIQSDETAICLRKGEFDYHFMKLSDNKWYHKPGLSHILQYKYLPTRSLIWSDERFFMGVSFCPDNYYDSDIYYIIYQENHIISYNWTGNHYHSGSQHYYQYADVCNSCGEIVFSEWVKFPCPGTTCVTPWSIEEYNITS